MSHEELKNLLIQSREKNKTLDITGMLLYREGTFMQIIEGEKKNVVELYDTILRDERHHGILEVLTGEITERNFEDWSMGFLNMDSIDGHPKYKVYIRDNFTLKSFREDSQDAYEFIKTFNEINQ